MNKFVALLILLIFSSNAFSQELYTPRNIKKAYEKGTRSFDGKPGKNYWQNGGEYKIDFKVYPTTKIVSGVETINYSNNSPDTLKTAVIRFVTNLHKPTSPRSGKVSKDFLDEGLKIKSLSVNGQNYSVNSDDWETFFELKLNSPILPKSKTQFKIEWEYPCLLYTSRCV